MAYLRTIQVNGQNFELPPAGLPNNLINLNDEMTVVGVSASELINSIYQLRDAFAQLNDKVGEIQENLHDLRYQCYNGDEALNCRAAALECELSELRSALDAMTVKPKRKNDLEIFSQIETNPYISSFIDLDSEAFLNQRPLWDFTVDF